jgi:serine/threonine protein kinase
MPLAPGTQLGPYEITAALGAGGMGEVYRARDRRLERTVAIKVLPAQFSADVARKQRFEREAKTISQLNHPHICTLHDIGSQDGIEYLVMEYVEGHTLANRLQKGPLPLEQVLKLGEQIADALDNAHRSGVVHRDLKPGNIMLTQSGAKLLDFGLARLIELPSVDPAGLSKLTTESDRLTEPGTILGTWQYMAPEQLEGKDADVRTDIFSLGAVIFEMGTGRPAFTGKSKASVIASILSHTPPAISEFQKICPPSIDHLVRNCLEKDPDQRWQSARDLANELKWAAVMFSRSEQGSSQGKKALRVRLAVTAAVLAFCVALATAFAYWKLRPEPAAVVRLSLLPPNKTSFSFAGLALSPEGRRLAFTTTGPKEKQGLWVRSFDSEAAQLVPGTQDAHDPFWLPDGRSIAFFTQDKLKRVASSGGTPEILCSIPSAATGTWNRTGVVLFSSGTYQPIKRLNLSDCSIKPVTHMDESRKEVYHFCPFFLPDGTHFFFVVLRLLPDKGLDVYLASLEKDERQLVISNGSAASYVSPGYLVFSREGKLMGQAFDAATLRTQGDAFPIVQEQVNSEHFSGTTSYSASGSGTLVYQPNIPHQFQLQWMDRSGKDLERVAEGGLTQAVQLSPDGKRVLVNRLAPDTEMADVWILDAASRAWSRFTFEPTPVPEARWSPDGKQIVYMSRRQGVFRIERKPADGSGTSETLLESGRWVAPRSWSTDGRELLYESVDPETGFDLWAMPLSGDRRPAPYVQTRFNEGNAAFAPGGKWVAYVSDKSGQNEVYVRPFAEPGAELKVSSGTTMCPQGGCVPPPRWRADGRELFYISGDWKLMSVPINASPELQAGAARALFALPEGAEFDVNSDGQRFLLNMPVQSVGSAPLSVVLNWTAEHKP